MAEVEATEAAGAPLEERASYDIFFVFFFQGEKKERDRFFLFQPSASTQGRHLQSSPKKSPSSFVSLFFFSRRRSSSKAGEKKKEEQNTRGVEFFLSFFQQRRRIFFLFPSKNKHNFN